MLVGIHQPHYLPWLRYFEKIDACDAFVLLDTVQFTKNGWQNRNKIKSAQGELILTVPVHARLDTTIQNVTLDGTQSWPRRHSRAIEQNYRNAPHYNAVLDRIGPFYETAWTSLADLNRALLNAWLELLGIDTPIYEASALKVGGTGTERLANLVRAVGGDSYYTGAFAVQTYLEPEALNRAGIGLQLQEWTAPSYPQQYGDFIPDLSILDLFMNVGPDSLAILRRGGGRDE